MGCGNNFSNSGLENRIVLENGVEMPTIETCGHEAKRTTFSYQGCVRNGVIIEFESGNFEVDSNAMSNILNHFKGKTVLGGFSMTTPTPGGVGEFISSLGGGLTSRHGSFLCAIMQNEGYVKCGLDGNSVVVSFNA